MRAIVRCAALAFLSPAAATRVLVFSPLSASAAVVISSAATRNFSCSGGVCVPTAKDAVLNANDLTSLLANSNVEVSTGTGSLAAKVEDIDIAAGFNWSGANSLTLDAYRSIAFRKGAVAVNGMGAVALVTNDGGTAGGLSFQPGASLSFASNANSLTINGVSFTLENSIAALARAIGAYSAGNFALANSFDASKDGKYHASPIDTPLEGTVEGLGNTISNLSIIGPHIANKPDFEIGLFSEIERSATVSDLVITNLEYCLSPGSSTIGGLAGSNAGLIVNNYVNGSICEGYLSGGLTANNSGIISQSHASVNITNSKTGLVSGGLVAVNYGTIELSSATGYVQGTVIGGGLVGENDDSISESFATGRVTGREGGANLGGLVGQDTGVLIQNSYATGFVKGGPNSFVGGLIGGSGGGHGSAYYSYSDGLVSGDGCAGGFIGDFSGYDITSSYWNTTTSKTDNGWCGGHQDAGFLTGLTSAELRAGLPAGFDPTIWAEKKVVNRGFPYLINNPPPKD